MIDQYKDYMSYLKSFVQGTQVSLSDDFDPEKLLAISNINGTDGIIGYMMMTNPDGVPGELSMMARQKCMRTIAFFARRAELMKVLIGQLSDHGIDHLLFKGFIVRDMYPVPELRSFSDIDFVIRKEDRERCDQLMIELGYKREADWEPVYGYVKDAEFYEIHTEVLEVDVSDKADYREYYSHMWDYTQRLDEHTYVFRPEYHLLYLLTHIAKHIYSSGAGIRMYLDIAFFLRYYQNQEFNWDFFQSESKKLGFDDFVNTVFSVVKEWFDVESPIPLKPLEDGMVDEFLAFTLEGGTFGRFGRSASVNYLRQENQNDEESVSKFSTLVRRAFPSAERLKVRYTYLEKCPWLLPFAWVHRLFKTREKIGYHMNEAKGIMNADEEEVLKYKKIYKGIGL